MRLTDQLEVWICRTVFYRTLNSVRRHQGAATRFIRVRRSVHRMSDASSQLTPKDLVLTWFAAGMASPEGLAMTTDDFVWRPPASMASDFGLEDGVLPKSRLKELELLNRAMYADADDPSGMNFHFIIGEGDIVVLEFDSTRTLHDGSRYHNQYCLVVHVREGKIAGVNEHTDSHYVDRMVLGTPESRDGVFQRLADLRAQLG